MRSRRRKVCEKQKDFTLARYSQASFRTRFRYVTERELPCVFSLFKAPLSVFLSLFKAISRRFLGAYFGWPIETFGAPCPLPLDINILHVRPLDVPSLPSALRAPSQNLPGASNNNPGALPKRPSGAKKSFGLATKKSRAPFGRPFWVGAPPHRGGCGAYIYATGQL